MDIKQALKEEIKSLQAQLKRAEKSLEAYAGEQAPKAPKAPRTSSGPAAPPAPGAAGPATPGNLPERITAYLGTNGLKSVDELVVALNAPKGQVATTCSRLVKHGKLEKHEQAGKPTLYSEAVAPVEGVAPPNPFAQGTN